MPEKTLTSIQVGVGTIVVIFLIVFKEFLKKIVSRFFSKTVETEYVTVDQCSLHRTEIKEQTDYKIEMSKNEALRMLEEINKNIGSQNNHLETMNETLVIGIMNNDSLTEDQKQKCVIDLSKRKK